MGLVLWFYSEPITNVSVSSSRFWSLSKPALSPNSFLLSLLTPFHSRSPSLSLPSLSMVQLTRTLFSLIYGPLYLQGDTQHNEEGRVSLLFFYDCLLSCPNPVFCLKHSQWPAQWKTVSPLLLTFIVSFPCRDVLLDVFIFTAHSFCCPLLCFFRVFFCLFFCTFSPWNDLTIWISEYIQIILL